MKNILLITLCLLSLHLYAFENREQILSLLERSNLIESQPTVVGLIDDLGQSTLLTEVDKSASVDKFEQLFTDITITIYLIVLFMFFRSIWFNKEHFQDNLF